MSRVALAADESRLLEEPPPRSLEEDTPPLERTFEKSAERDRGLLPRVVPAVDEALTTLPPFLRDTRIGVDFRTYYFRRRTVDNRDQEAAAIGGVLDYRSGWLWDRLQAGAALFTSQKLYGPQRRDGTGLLAEGQDGYTALGEAFLRARALKHELTGYRQRLALPYLNGNDSRITPNTFEGISLEGDLGPVRYISSRSSSATTTISSPSPEPQGCAAVATRASPSPSCASSPSRVSSWGPRINTCRTR